MRPSGRSPVPALFFCSPASPTTTRSGPTNGRGSWPTPSRPRSEPARSSSSSTTSSMYGRVQGPMTEDTTFNPCSRKGEIRAQIATTLLNEIRAGLLTAMIARAPDFYGPATPTGVANLLVFDAWRKNQKASWLVNDSVAPFADLHARRRPRGAHARRVGFGVKPERASAAAPHPPIGREFITLAAGAMHRAPALPRCSRRSDGPHVTGGLSGAVGELYETL